MRGTTHTTPLSACPGMGSNTALTGCRPATFVRCGGFSRACYCSVYVYELMGVGGWIDVDCEEGGMVNFIIEGYPAGKEAS